MTLTAGQLGTAAIALIGLILTILNIVDRVTTMRKNANAPFKELQDRVTVLEVKVLDQETRLLKGNDTFRKQAKFNNMLERVILAFIDFEIAYCHNTGYTDTVNLMKAKSTLEDLLTNDKDED